MLKAFIDQFRSVEISTIDAEGFPFASYAPFVRLEDLFYIYISDIATHAQNIKTDQKAALLFIEDESACEQIFARKRVMLQCATAMIAREDETFNRVMALFAGRFDEKTVNMLQSMQDFNLYALTPLRGEAVFGFGEAYEMREGDLDAPQPKRSGGHKNTVKR